MINKAPLFTWRPDHPILEETNLQDGTDDGIEAEFGPDNLFEYDGYSDDSEIFDQGSHEWIDENDRGFSSNEPFQNVDELALNKDDPGHYTINWDNYEESHDERDFF